MGPKEVAVALTVRLLVYLALALAGLCPSWGALVLFVQSLFLEAPTLAPFEKHLALLVGFRVLGAAVLALFVACRVLGAEALALSAACLAPVAEDLSLGGTTPSRGPKELHANEAIEHEVET